MSESWYYADASNHQKGPVPADVLRYLHGRGEVTAATLVWREGLAGWEPLARHAATLGIGAAPAAAARTVPPAASRPRVTTSAGRPVVVKPSGGGSGWVIAIVVLFVGIMVIGVLAAIALPAYSDYTTRAKVAQAINETSYLKVVVSEYVVSTGKCPANGDADIGTPESYASETIAAIRVGTDEGTGGCTIQVVFNAIGGASPGSELVLTRNDSGSWSSSSNLPDRVLPASMRQR